MNTYTVWFAQFGVESFGFALLRSVIGLQNLRHFLSQWESKTKPILFLPHAFSRAWRQLHVLISNSDWLVVLFISVAINHSSYFGFGFTTLSWKPLYADCAQRRSITQTCCHFKTPKCLSVSKKQRNNCRVCYKLSPQCNKTD